MRLTEGQPAALKHWVQDTDVIAQIEVSLVVAKRKSSENSFGQGGPLLLKKEIKDINSIKKDNYKEEAYESSLNYINKKMRTTKEIINYLSKKEYSKEITEPLD